MESEIHSINKTTRLAGVLYLLWILTGMYAMFYIPSQIKMEGDPVKVAHSILSNEFLFRTLIFNDLISSVIWIFMVFLFYRLFKPINVHYARLLVALVIVQIPAMFFMEGCNYTALMLLKGEVLKTFELSQKQELALLFLKINDYTIILLEAFWGLWLFPLGILVYKSMFLPRFLGVWLLINGVGFLMLFLTTLLMPEHKDIVFNITIPAMLGEMAFMLWLLIRGAKTSVPAIEKSDS